MFLSGANTEILAPSVFIKLSTQMFAPAMQIEADVRQVSVKVYVSYRYWLFSDEVPGLFIEKGWVHDSIDYRFVLPHQKKEDSRKDCSPGGMLSLLSAGVVFVAGCSNGLMSGRELSSPSWGYSD